MVTFSNLPASTPLFAPARPEFCAVARSGASSWEPAKKPVGSSFSVFVDGDPASIRQLDTDVKKQTFLEHAPVRPWESRPVSGSASRAVTSTRGRSMKEGDVLAKLDDEKIAVQLAQAKATLEKLKTSYERNVDLHKQSLISTEVFQQSKYDYESQKANYDLAELEFKYATIRTPISGVVAERLIKVGNMVLPNQAVFRVAGLDPLIAVLHVPERQLGKLRTGLAAQLTVDASSTEPFTGRIERISPVIDPATGTVKVTVEVRDPSRRLKPGMFARINIIYDVHENVLTAPKDAIISEDRENAVFVVRDSVAYRQIVTTGYVNTTAIEVLSGLVVDQVAVVARVPLAREGRQADAQGLPRPAPPRHEAKGV